MKRSEKLPELLSPAGDMESLVAAILGGADAVYVGGMRFGARAYAKNFTMEELARAVKLCHAFGVRLYVTLNTLIFDKEVDEALEYARELYGIGIDALIVADLGILCLITKNIPELEVHASTQMGAHNTEGVNFAARLGASRAVIARECSGDDIAKIVKESLCECEVFLHGALCVCHSGQCLFSSMVGGRSGNRGECAQPCRLPYSGRYPLSLKDLSLADHVRELIESGVSSLKIEGRMKSPSYVYEVTRIYRTLLDSGRNANPTENERLSNVFSRGGFTDGYFVNKVDSIMTGVRSEDDKRASRELSSDKLSSPRLKLTARAAFALGVPSSLTLTATVTSALDGSAVEISVSADGDVPRQAENAPLVEDALKERLSKMGSTDFSLSQSDIELSLEEGINLAPSAINALRRGAVCMLEERLAKPLDLILGIRQEKREPYPEIIAEKQKNKRLMKTALFFGTDSLKKLSGIDLCGIDTVFVPLFEYYPFGGNDSVKGVYIPPVIMESEWDEVRRELVRVKALGASYALIGNISHISLVREAGIEPVGDFRLNITNRYTAALYRHLGVNTAILSPELTLPQARDIGGGVITLGRIPLMLTERCFIRENFGCNKCGKSSFTDRKGMKFPIMREWKHRNVIFNSAPTYMADKQHELRAAGITHEHYIFSSESATEILDLLRAAKAGKALRTPSRRIGKR